MSIDVLKILDIKNRKKYKFKKMNKNELFPYI